MRIIFLGSGDFAVPSLEAVRAGNHEIAAVITQPARKAGRGRKVRQTPAAAAGHRLGLHVVECADVNSLDAIRTMREFGADVICVADFGQFVRAAARGTARLGAFNLHGSLLPELRGAAPVNWAIIRGHEHTGVTTFRLVDRMDAGPIYLQAGTEIGSQERADELGVRLAQMGAELVCTTLGLLTAGDIESYEQDERLATFAPRLKKSDGLIDFSAEATAIRNLIHGAWPWPGARASVRRHDGSDVEVILAQAEAIDEPSRSDSGVVDEESTIGTGRGRLRILEIQPVGKRLMTWRDFLNGYRIGPGDRLTRLSP